MQKTCYLGGKFFPKFAVSALSRISDASANSWRYKSKSVMVFRNCGFWNLSETSVLVSFSSAHNVEFGFADEICKTQIKLIILSYLFSNGMEI